MGTLNRSKAVAPHFLCVGPEKTGTSWLYRALSLHPDIMLPPVKEIRFFYERWAYPNEGVLARFSRNGDWHNKDYRAYLLERARYYKANPSLILRKPAMVCWDARYLFGSHSATWYMSLFPQSNSQISGDFSPQYVSLPVEEIRYIRDLLPLVKIIILLREPVEWTWSFARMSLIQGRDVSGIQDDEYYRFFTRYKNYYPSTLIVDRWISLFGENVFIGFFDHIASEPLRLLNRVLDFLGLQQISGEHSRALATRVNVGIDVAIPSRFDSFLRREYKGIVEDLADRFEDPPRSWLVRY